MSRDLLVFVKNPVLGKVKTRLAKRVGEEEALRIYGRLLSYTLRVTSQLALRRWVAYSDFIPSTDIWIEAGFRPLLQCPQGDLGQRLSGAASDVFEFGCSKLLVIGSDCEELLAGHLTEALEALDHHPAVIGPCFDGGYYLLGLRRFAPEIFRDIAWSTPAVLTQTLERFRELHWSWHSLPCLHDTDE